MRLWPWRCTTDLGDAERVHTVLERRDVLLDGERLPLADLAPRTARPSSVPGGVSGGDRQGRVVVEQSPCAPRRPGPGRAAARARCCPPPRPPGTGCARRAAPCGSRAPCAAATGRRRRRRPPRTRGACRRAGRGPGSSARDRGAPASPVRARRRSGRSRTRPRHCAGSGRAPQAAHRTAPNRSQRRPSPSTKRSSSATPASFKSVCDPPAAAASTAARSWRESCSAGDSPYQFGSASRTAAAMTAADQGALPEGIALSRGRRSRALRRP